MWCVGLSGVMLPVVAVWGGEGGGFRLEDFGGGDNTVVDYRRV